MRKATWIFSIGILTLLLLQGLWGFVFYRSQEKEFAQEVSLAFDHAMQEEVMIRKMGAHPNKQNPGYRYRSDSIPTDAEKKQGDSLISINEAARWGLGTTLSDLIAHTLQNKLMYTKPLQLPVLDSVFQKEKQRDRLPDFRYKITMYNQKNEVVQSLDKGILPVLPATTLKLKPVGTKGVLFISVQIQVLPDWIWKKMFPIFFLSLCMVCFLIYCLFNLLKKLRILYNELEERQQTIHSAIHDLKRPLNNLYTILDFSESIISDKQITDFLTKSKIQIQNITETINSMLYVLKKDNRLLLSSFDLPEMIRTVENRIHSSFAEKTYQFHIENPQGIENIYADKTRIERCLSNLIENSLKYSDDGVNITVLLTKQNGKLSISVRDTGWGIAKRHYKNIGKQFFRIRPQNRPEREGYGLGLCSVKILCKEMNGNLSFKSEENKGSEFTMTLKIKNADKQ